MDGSSLGYELSMKVLIQSTLNSLLRVWMKMLIFVDSMINFKLEQKIIDEGCQERDGIMNGVSWFKLPKAKCNPDVIASKFGPIVKVSKDKETGEPDGKWPSQ